MNFEQLNILTLELIQLREQINTMTERMNTLKEDKDFKHTELLKIMKTIGLKSWKTETNTFSRISKPNIKVINEPLVIQEIRKRSLPSYLIQEKIDTDTFKTLALSFLKDTGEIFEGTEYITTEYISIRSNKKDQSTSSEV